MNTQAAKIPVDSIRFPALHLQAIQGWEGGLDCTLRAVTSTGNLTLGTTWHDCETDEEWYLAIWENLSEELSSLIRKHTSARSELQDVLDWVNSIVRRLSDNYGLDN